MVWVLLIMAHVGPMGKGNSNSLATVSGFRSEASCKVAAVKAHDLETGTKNIMTVCVELK